MIHLEKNELISNIMEELLGWLISSDSKNIWATHFIISLQGDKSDAEDILKVAWAQRFLKVTVAVSDESAAGVKLNKITVFL